LRKQPPFLFDPGGNIAGRAAAGNRMKAVDPAADCGGKAGAAAYCADAPKRMGCG